MDEENTMDFKALRAKFQDGELLQMQPKIKPALPDKPKQVPPPQSPTHYLPAGARPSLLTSINQSLESKTPYMPRVVFKDDKKESKAPLIETNSKEKDKGKGKLKVGKDKTSKSKSHDVSSDQKQKKENNKDKRFSLVLPSSHKDGTAELVAATPPPKSATLKKGFLGFKKSSKQDSYDFPTDPILDSLSPNIEGPAPLIPVPCNFEDAESTTKPSKPNALVLDIPTLPDSSDTPEVSPVSFIPDIPEFSPPPAFIPETPSYKVEIPDIETPLEIGTPALPVSRPTSQTQIISSPPSASSTPPPSTIASALPVASSPTPPPSGSDIADEADIEAVNMAPVATPPSLVEDPTFIPPSPKLERPISALSALERAEELSPGKRTPPNDQRVLNALEKARKKTPSPAPNATSSNSITPPLEEQSPPHSPTLSLPDLPPIDYEDRARNASAPKSQAQTNGLDRTAEAFPLLEGIGDEGPEAVPKLLVAQPTRKKVFPDRSSLGPPPEKPSRPPTVHLTEFIAPVPLVEDHPSSAELPVSAEPLKTEPTEVPVLDVVGSGVHTPDLQVPELVNGQYTGPDAPDGRNLPQYYMNVTSTPVPVAAAVSAPGDKDQGHGTPARPEAEVSNNVYETSENVYEESNTSSTKKKGKKDSNNKRKGPPKNPYTEAAQVTKEEKTRTGRFGKSEKKAPADGPDEKELKKREKQRLEKEKKELKEKQEREKKEQKEREKRQNEIKKKFKVTGHEEAMYQARVTVTTKGNKTDLPVKDGDIVSIIRTSNCPKGKWLARDNGSNYGYVAVDHVQLDISEMVELGKKTGINRMSGSNFVDGDVTATGNRFSNHYPPAGDSSDEGEEWDVDEDDAASPNQALSDPLSPTVHSRTFSMPDMGNKDLSINHQHSYSADGSQVQARNEALQKLTTFFHSPKPVEPVPSSPAVETSPVLEDAVQPVEDKKSKDLDFEHPEMLILPPPDLYA